MRSTDIGRMLLLRIRTPGDPMQAVEQVMTRSVIAVTTDTPISEVARLLVDRAISGLPVVDADGRVVGVVSEGDILLREAGHAPPSRRPLARFTRSRSGDQTVQRKVGAATAGELMTSPALTLEPHRALRTAAEIMTAKGVNRLPIVDENRRLVGIVTRADLVRAFVRTDEQLVEAIRMELFGRMMWIDPDKFEITVDQGTAKVSGAVLKRSTAELIERFLHTVPGVVAAETHITWTEDDGGLTTAP
jgi:CBS domain-containing protein